VAGAIPAARFAVLLTSVDSSVAPVNLTAASGALAVACAGATFALSATPTVAGAFWVSVLFDGVPIPTAESATTAHCPAALHVTAADFSAAHARVVRWTGIEESSSRAGAPVGVEVAGADSYGNAVSCAGTLAALSSEFNVELTPGPLSAGSRRKARGVGQSERVWRVQLVLLSVRARARTYVRITAPHH